MEGSIEPLAAKDILAASAERVEIQPAYKAPKRPLSAYNFFFKAHRQQILESMNVRPQGRPRRSHGKIGFRELAQTIASRWNNATDLEKEPFKVQAREDKARYNKEKKEYKVARKNDDKSDERAAGARSSQLASKEKGSHEGIHAVLRERCQTPSAIAAAVVTPTHNATQPYFFMDATDQPLHSNRGGIGDLPPELLEVYRRRVQQYSLDEYYNLVQHVHLREQFPHELPVPGPSVFLASVESACVNDVDHTNLHGQVSLEDDLGHSVDRPLAPAMPLAPEFEDLPPFSDPEL